MHKYFLDVPSFGAICHERMSPSFFMPRNRHLAVTWKFFQLHFNRCYREGWLKYTSIPFVFNLPQIRVNPPLKCDQPAETRWTATHGCCFHSLKAPLWMHAAEGAANHFVAPLEWAIIIINTWKKLSKHSSDFPATAPRVVNSFNK